MAVVHANDTNFQALVTENKKVVVDFWATWCGPCRMLAPIIEEIANENQGSLKVGKVDVDEQSELAMKFGIMSIPTLILFKDGKPVAQSLGYKPKAQIEAMFK